MVTKVNISTFYPSLQECYKVCRVLPSEGENEGRVSPGFTRLLDRAC